MLASALVCPHLFVYDCALLAPALLILCDWALGQTTGSRDRRLVLAGIYLLCVAFLVPVARVIPFQPSVPLTTMVFAVAALAITRAATPAPPDTTAPLLL